MKTLQSEMEIQEQVVEVVERNMRVCEGKAAAEEEEAAVFEMEMECVRVKMESEKEKARGMEEEEAALKEAIAKAQALERKLQKEGLSHSNRPCFTNLHFLPLFSFFFLTLLSGRWPRLQGHEAVAEGNAGGSGEDGGGEGREAKDPCEVEGDQETVGARCRLSAGEGATHLLLFLAYFLRLTIFISF